MVMAQVVAAKVGEVMVEAEMGEEMEEAEVVPRRKKIRRPPWWLVLAARAVPVARAAEGTAEGWAGARGCSTWQVRAEPISILLSWQAALLASRGEPCERAPCSPPNERAVRALCGFSTSKEPSETKLPFLGSATTCGVIMEVLP